MTQHTPTPWHLGDERHGDWYIWGPDPAAYGYIVQVNACGSTTNPREEREANAEFLIRAVNSHDALLAACRLARTVLADYGQTALCRRLTDAIAAAEGDEK